MKKKNLINLSIIIPALDEAAYIGKTLKSTAKYLAKEGLINSTEIIVVAAKHKDNTAQIAKANKNLFKHFRVIEPDKKIGKGRDVNIGIMAAHGKYRLFMDADLATPLHHIKPTLKLLDNGTDLVYGVRDLRTMHKVFFRKLSSISANYLIRMALLPGVKDSQCGFKAINWNTSRQVYTKQTILHWGFDLELLLIAKNDELKIATLPIPDWSDPKEHNGLSGESNISAMVSTLNELLTIRINNWKGIYK